MERDFGKVPLERALSKLGAASRSQTRDWVLKGRLQVNGRTVRDTQFMVSPEKDRFTVDGKPMVKDSWQAIMLNKPKAVVTTASDEKGRRTVFDLLPAELRSLHPVGRLDMATTGLLILTNDTRLSSYLTDPANAVPRTYLVTVAGEMTEAELARAAAGILDEGELLKPSRISLRKASGRESHLTVELTEGKNRELRRLFEALGHEVTALKRVAFGPLQLGALEPGRFRRLTKEELHVKEAPPAPAIKRPPAPWHKPRDNKRFKRKMPPKRRHF
ncbi:MAG: rRNA pseudouridine synthase [Elusimicrobia bacterium]|nr:rRNA pseudouridine synthase [Elusimicrobiota bacterium]